MIDEHGIDDDFAADQPSRYCAAGVVGVKGRSVDARLNRNGAGSRRLIGNLDPERKRTGAGVNINGIVQIGIIKTGYYRRTVVRDKNRKTAVGRLNAVAADVQVAAEYRGQIFGNGQDKRIGIARKYLSLQVPVI